MSQDPETSPTAHVPEIDLEHKTLSQNLQGLIDPENPRDLTVRRLLQVMEEKGFGLLLIILSLPSALPLPAPGYSTPFGIVLMILAIQMIMGRRRPALPQKFQNISINYKLARKMIDAACNFLGWTEKFIKPRFRWVGSPAGERALGIVVLIMGGLMAIPLPSTNTGPAMVIFALGVGLVEEDGLVCALAFILGLLVTLMYIVILYLIIRFGVEIVEQIKDQVKEWLGMGEKAATPPQEPPIPEAEPATAE
jgi:hypothetical protein